jgi:hypothetical protein
MARALEALDDAEIALRELDAGCCEPGRSPRMKALGGTLGKARSMLPDVGSNPERADDLMAELEAAGSQIGSLQVLCCAPDRMPLYTEMLTGLMTVQRSINTMVRRGH